MKIALIGNGTMGRLVGELAKERGHEAALVIDHADVSLSASELAAKLAKTEVAIDFSTAEAVRRNVEACVFAGVSLVEGTTGWNAERDEIEALVTEGNGSFVFGANFSIGVNLLYRITGFAAELFARFPEYEVFIEEQHHSRKKDAPSGTALKLKEIVGAYIDWEVGVSSTRAGNIPGTHRVGFDGTSDQVMLAHTARSRHGFASGAIVAAEWIKGRKGFFSFDDVMDEICKGQAE